MISESQGRKNIIKTAVSAILGYFQQSPDLNPTPRRFHKLVHKNINNRSMLLLSDDFRLGKSQIFVQESMTSFF